MKITGTILQYKMYVDYFEELHQIIKVITIV